MADGVKRFRQVNEDCSRSVTSVCFFSDKVCKESYRQFRWAIKGATDVQRENRWIRKQLKYVVFSLK